MLSGDKNIAKWVMESIGTHHNNMTAIGEIKDGKLIAGIAFECYSKNNLFGHMRIDKSPSREYWIMVADYIFNQSGCKRFTATVEASNTKAIRLNKHIGFEIEAVLKEAGTDGDLLIMVLWKNNCKFLEWKK